MEASVLCFLEPGYDRWTTARGGLSAMGHPWRGKQMASIGFGPSL
jgi:hypothetical protein